MDRAMSGTLHSTSPRLSCYGDNAVERQSTVSLIGNSRLPLYAVSTLYALPQSTEVYLRRG